MRIFRDKSDVPGRCGGFFATDRSRSVTSHADVSFQFGAQCVYGSVTHSRASQGSSQPACAVDWHGFRCAYIPACRPPGVLGYVLKDASSGDVAAAVRSVAKDEAVCPPSLCRVLFEQVAAPQVEPPVSRPDILSASRDESSSWWK